MIDKLNTDRKVVGLKQTRRAIKEGTAAEVFIARDASAQIREELETLCGEKKVPVKAVESMQELGESCGINVGAAAAAFLK